MPRPLHSKDAYYYETPKWHANLGEEALNDMKRVCKKCGNQKKLEDFVKNEKCHFGRGWECRECRNRFLKEYNRKYFQNPYNRVKKRVADIVGKKRYRKEHPELRYGRLTHNEEHKRKYRVNLKVFRAIEKGILFKEPCNVCNKKKIVHAHHDDYLKPLDVRWLCPVHHKAEHTAKVE